MTREDKIFEMAKAIAHEFVSINVLNENLTRKVFDEKTVLEYYAQKLKIWATAFVDELEKEEVNNEEVK